MTQKLRRFSRISAYALTLLLTSAFSFFLQLRNNKSSDQKISLIPPVPTAYADVPPSDDSDNPSESAACSCTCSDDSDDSDDSGDDSDGDGGDF